MKEIELFNSLNFNKKIDFETHMFNIKQNHTIFIITCYLNKITNNYNNEISINNFLLLITIYHYIKEFVLTEIEKDKIENYINKYYYINNSLNNCNIKEINKYYDNNIKNNTKEIREILNNILENTSIKAKEQYIKMYYFYNNLYNKFNKEYIKEKKNSMDCNESLNEFYKKKTYYYNLLKNMLNNINIDDFINNKINELKLYEQYNIFEKKLFFEMLIKDLNKNPIDYNSIIYLLDIIRIKLCNIAPIKEKYNYIKDNINNILDIKYIKQLINNDVFDFNNIINIFNFIIEKIEQFQSENDDIKLNEIKTIIKNDLINNNNNINIILPKIMYNIMDIIDRLEQQTIYYRNLLNK